MKESATAVMGVTHESVPSVGSGKQAAHDGAPGIRSGRRAIVRSVSVVAAWRRGEGVSWG